jgi:hypothetical protein
MEMMVLSKIVYYITSWKSKQKGEAAAGMPCGSSCGRDLCGILSNLWPFRAAVNCFDRFFEEADGCGSFTNVL